VSPALYVLYYKYNIRGGPEKLEERVAFCYHREMPQPVKLSDALVLEARLAAESRQRSIAGQVEYWASLGRSMEDLLDGATQRRLLQRGGTQSLSYLLDTVEKPEGRRRLKAYLDSEPFPHFEQHSTDRRLLIRIEANGARSVGRFVNRQFVTEQDLAQSAAYADSRKRTAARPTARRARATA